MGGAVGRLSEHMLMPQPRVMMHGPRDRVVFPVLIFSSAGARKQRETAQNER